MKCSTCKLCLNKYELIIWELSHLVLLLDFLCQPPRLFKPSPFLFSKYVPLTLIKPPPTPNVQRC